MAWQLFRLGRWCFQHRRAVVATWLILLVAVGIGSKTLSGKTDDQFSLQGIESTQAFDLIKARTPNASPDGATAQIVFKAAPGQTLTSPAGRSTIEQALAKVKTGDVASVSAPFTAGTVSKDGTVAYATIGYTKQAVDLTDADKSAAEAAKAAAQRDGMTVALGGDAFQSTPAGGAAEGIGIVIALVVLLITFGSLVSAGMPLLTAIIGVGVGMLGITTLTGFLTLSSTTSALGSMLGLAVGIDYALFIMSRYQHEVRAGRDPEEAIGRAVGTAGSAVVFAGLTVIIALAGLSICGIGFLTQMGLGGAGMVALAVLIALTLLPALLGFAGRRVVRSKSRFLKARDTEAGDARTNGRRWVELVARLRVPFLVGGILLAAVLSFPVAKMQLALPDNATAAAGSDQRVAYDLIADHFGAGANGPLVVVVDTANTGSSRAAVAAVDTAVGTIESVKSDVVAVVPPAGAGSSATPAARAQLTKQLDAVGYATVAVIPASGPSDQATKDLVGTLRADLAGLPGQTGAHALVTGQTAVGVDISQKLTEVFPRYLLVVVGLAFILLVLVFRSILVPLKAAIGFLLSVGISLGVTVAVFQWGWLNNLIGLDVTTPVIFILPLLLTGVLFGLAMDYEVFLVTRMREAFVHGEEARAAVRTGFSHSARVVTAAAAIMTGVFAGFALGDDVMIKTIGFALAVGVIADAFLVRMTLVPALMSIIGRHIWWLPRWLDRLLPNLDIEGEGLHRRLQESEAEREPVSLGR